MDYYRKPINKVVNDVKLKMQLGALTLKLNENNKKIDDLIGVDKNIKNDISGKINNKNDISKLSLIIKIHQIFQKIIKYIIYFNNSEK